MTNDFIRNYGQKILLQSLQKSDTEIVSQKKVYGIQNFKHTSFILHALEVQ